MSSCSQVRSILRWNGSIRCNRLRAGPGCDCYCRATFATPTKSFWHCAANWSVWRVHGERDRLVPFANVAWMEQQFSAVPVLEKHALKEEDHFLPWTQPALIQRLVNEALEQ